MVISWSLLMFGVFALFMVVFYRNNKPSRYVGLAATVLCFWLCITSGDVMALIPTVVVGIVALIAHAYTWRRRVFLGSTVGVVVLATLASLPRSFELASLLEDYPPESLADRLTPRKTEYAAIPELKINASRTPLSKEARPEYEEIEAAHYRRRERQRQMWRQRALSRLSGLHNRSLKIFSDAPGFGVSRVRRMPIRRSVIDLPELPLLPLPMNHKNAVTTRPADGYGSWFQGLPAGTSGNDVRTLHIFSVSDFMNSEGFVRPSSLRQRRQRANWGPDPRNVVGFQSHGFRDPPQPVPGRLDSWEVVRLDLVSLWLNDPPAVYDSDNLPRMGELSTAPTRALDSFETAALKHIATLNAVLQTQFSSDSIRILGAIRASKACLECHDVRRDHLLGAFSYELRQVDRPRNSE
jgi:hypothetical protein